MNSKPIDKNLQTVIHGWSGALAGAISTLILYPMENLKTRMQTNEQNSNLIQIIKKVAGSEGIQAFYKGMTPMLAGNFISYGIYFYWYQLFKDYFNVQQGDNLSYLKVSSLAGIITTIGTNPFWVVQTRSVVGNQNNDNFLKIMLQMIQKEGIFSLFKGLSASLILVINPIVQFITYEYLKEKLSGSISSQFLLYFICGAISKAIATIITFPYQVIRTFTHVDKDKKSKSLSQIIKKIFEEQGFQGFFKGLSPKLIQTVLNSAFMLSFYEEIVKVISFYVTRKQNQMERIN
ncbi:hypothetical protein ABPG74_003256 [Tetrahymena malaccensis]